MKPLRTEIPFSTPWFRVAAKTLQEGEEPYYSLQLPDYAATVALTPDHRIVLVRQYRSAVERETLELPSGLVDEGESPADAARRELLEETGYEAPEIDLLGPLLPDTGRLGNRIWCCFAGGVLPARGWRPEEGITVELLDLRALRDAVHGGRFDHALHVAALLMAQIHGKVPDLPGPAVIKSLSELPHYRPPYPLRRAGRNRPPVR